MTIGVYLEQRATWTDIMFWSNWVSGELTGGMSSKIGGFRVRLTNFAATG